MRLKLEKSKSKSAFTKARYSLLHLFDEEDLPSCIEVRMASEKLNVCLDTAMEALSRLSAFYESEKDSTNDNKVCKEIEQIDGEYTIAQNRTQEYLDA